MNKLLDKLYRFVYGAMSPREEIKMREMLLAHNRQLVLENNILFSACSEIATTCKGKSQKICVQAFNDIEQS